MALVRESNGKLDGKKGKEFLGIAAFDLVQLLPPSVPLNN